jgi:uncharacterized protein (DUF58 family)
MLSPRGWWMLLLTLVVGTIGGVMSLRGSPTLLLVCVAVALWYTWEWAVFCHRTRITVRRLRLQRDVVDDRGPVKTLWAGRSYQVSVRVMLKRGRLPFAILTDRWPAGATITEGQPRYAGAVTANSPVTWQYRVRCDRVGVVRFEGVRIRLADLQGLFYFETFLRDPVEYLALPALTGLHSSRRGDKRFNMLPPPGVHRFRRPGTGSELLELRDYRPGDPPKRIAWKISARKDELITREFESEVPLRCTLIVDASSATRSGPPGNTALSRFCVIATGVAQTAIGNRDLVGLAVCTDDACTYLPPARSSTQLIAILGQLARAAALQPQAATNDIKALVTRAHALAMDVYPDLMSPTINQFPVWLPWFAPQPVYITRPNGGVRRSVWQRLRNFNSANARRRYAWRKRLAALVTAKYALPPGSLALMIDDNSACAWRLQCLLAEHRVPFDVSRTDDLDNDAPVIEQQARTLTRAVSRGRDNELFVLMGDYVQRSGRLTELLRSVRVARAKHHQVLVVQPGRPVDDVDSLADGLTADELVAIAGQQRFAHAWQATRRAFGRLGVPLAPTDAGDPVRLILHRLEQLRLIQGASRQ